MSRIALITGGQRGIGLGIARALKDAGFGLALVAEKSPGDAEVLDALEKLGPSAKYFQLDLSRTGSEAALLDQRIVAGLGNIYVCEALYRAGISPKKQAGVVSKPRLTRLVPVIREVISEAIEAGGSSLKDFRQTDGELGYFQHSFDAYGREGEPCRRAGCSGQIARIVQSGRSSFFCAQCQR